MSPQIEILATPLQYRTLVEFMYEILSAVPSPSPNQNPGAAHDFHPDITISHDEVINIFAFSSARRLNFILKYSAYFMVVYISEHLKNKVPPPRSKILEPLLRIGTCLFERTVCQSLTLTTLQTTSIVSAVAINRI